MPPSSVSPRPDAIAIELPSHARAVPLARGAICDLGLPVPIRDDAELLTSELVSNAVRHAGLSLEDAIQLRVRWSPPRLRVEVVDGGVTDRGQVAGSIRPRPGAASGWGLFLVDRLAVRWGRAPGRSWFELQVAG